MSSRGYLAAALVTLAGFAHATPPNAINISDIYLGASEAQVFLLRSLNDNLGLHMTDARDLYLIARNRAGTGPDEVWPIRRKLDHSPWQDLPDETIPVPDAADPFAIMAERDAWPAPLAATEGSTEIGYVDGMVIFTIMAPTGWSGPLAEMRFSMQLTDAATQLNNSHAATRSALEQYPGMNGGSDAVYIFDAATIATECNVGASGILRDDQFNIDTLLVQFDCNLTDEDYIGAQVYLVVPAS